MNFEPYYLKEQFTFLEAAYLWCGEPIPKINNPIEDWHNFIPPHNVAVVMDAFKSEVNNSAILIGNRINWGRKNWTIGKFKSAKKFLQNQRIKNGGMYHVARYEFFEHIRTNYEEVRKFGYNTNRCEFKPCKECHYKDRCWYSVGFKPSFFIPADENSNNTRLAVDAQKALQKEIDKKLPRISAGKETFIEYAINKDTRPAFFFPDVEKLTIRQTIEKNQKELSKANADNIKLKAELEKLQKEKLPPYMDEKHPYYSPKLEAAVSAWKEIFENRKGELPAKEDKIMKWLEKNRKDVPQHKRIFHVVNPPR